MNAITAIVRGEHVQFVSDDSDLLTGHVLDVQSHIGNGQKFAVIEIDHALPGIVYSVPLDRVSRMPAP
ncbi:hypothetical protein [Herbaspirillum sp. ST 5-3]|uniref:hypothetical protein n=1 Tax=Oxalobacteraceae TaxID=75682 RepID=UPI0010A2F0E4|nr:hypothetical protein [Herbaspirillum sp. ST 5-3]